MAELWDNPIRTDGFEFVEYAAPDPKALGALFEQMGFAAVATLYQVVSLLVMPPGCVMFCTSTQPAGALRPTPEGCTAIEATITSLVTVPAGLVMVRPAGTVSVAALLDAAARKAIWPCAALAVQKMIAAASLRIMACPA